MCEVCVRNVLVRACVSDFPMSVATFVSSIADASVQKRV